MPSILLLAVLAQSPLDSRVELLLIPITAQANVLETEHLGSGGRVTVRLNRYLGGYVSGFWNWHNTVSSAADALNDQVLRVDPYVPERVLSTWQAAAGVESIPLTGLFRVGAREGEFGIVLRAGLGVGGARLRLKPPTVRQDGTVSPATFGDAGLRLVGDFGLGFRFSFGAFGLHFGPRLSMWSDEASSVNGCTLDDLRAMDMKIRGGLDPAEASVSPGCKGFPNPSDIPLALNPLRITRSGLVLNLSADLGVSWSF
jgi:hypothetical protein